MASKGANPLLLYIGLACIAVALAAVGLSQLDAPALGRPPASAKPKPASAPAEKPPAPAPSPAKARQDEARAPAGVDSARARPSAARSTAEATRLLLARIEQTSAKLDTGWLAGNLQYVRDAAGLLAYLEEMRLVGAQRDSLVAGEQAREKVRPGSDPRYLVEQARQQLFSGRKSAAAYGRARDYLAVALFRQHRRQQGDWKKLDEVFTLALLRENAAAHPYSGPPGDAQVAGAWMREGLRAREALVMDRYLRLQEHQEKGRQQLKGTQVSAGAVVARTDLLAKGLNEALLGLGRFYAEAAQDQGEGEDEAAQQEHRDRAFRILAMLYRRTQSGDALKALRQLDSLKAGLLQAARATWEKARQAAKAGQRERADEYYFQALQQYLQCATRLEGEERQAASQELGQLRQELAGRQAREQPSAAMSQKP